VGSRRPRRGRGRPRPRWGSEIEVALRRLPDPAPGEIAEVSAAVLQAASLATAADLFGVVVADQAEVR